MNDFTPIAGLCGGALIGLAASLMFLTHGKIAGISGIFAGLLGRGDGERWFRLCFLGGLVAAGVVGHLIQPELVTPSPRSLPWVLAAGVVVGFGTRLGNGCTSGHGVCGISRLSKRSLVATATFMVTAMLTVWLCRVFT